MQASKGFSMSHHSIDVFRGANLAIEDACATVSVLREAANLVDSGQVTVAEAVRASTVTLDELRLSRRSAVAQISRAHAEHVANGGRAALSAETADWVGTSGGRVPTGQWRESLRSVWCGWPRAEACAAAARRQLQSVQTRTQSRTYTTETSTIGGTNGGSCQQQASLIAETATAASFRQFGRLVGVTEDGEMCVLATIAPNTSLHWNMRHSLMRVHAVSYLAADTETRMLNWLDLAET